MTLFSAFIIMASIATTSIPGMGPHEFENRPVSASASRRVDLTYEQCQKQIQDWMLGPVDSEQQVLEIGCVPESNQYYIDKEFYKFVRIDY